jgi:preprotein translocase subunit SecB
MADNETKTDGNSAAATTDGAASTAPQAGVIAQYTKDLSFENPNAPESFQTIANSQPKIDVNVGVNGRKLNEETYEVELKISATAKQGDDSTFVVELVYAGLFGLRNVPEDVIQPFMLVQAPAILFPFARRIIADATRDGGYPPLLLEPIDFGGLYQQQMAQQQAAAGDGNSEAAPAPEAS